jgi:replicative DNA helicase
VPTNPELLLISAMLRTRDHVLPASRGITAKMFHGYREQYEWIEQYVAVHGRTPSVAAFRDMFPGEVLKQVDDTEFFCGQVRENNSRILLKGGLQRVVSKLKAGDVASAIRELSSASIEAEASFLGHGSDGDIFRDYDDIKAEALRRKRQVQQTGFAGIPTGFPSLDELTGGLQPGWMVVVTARAGVAKTRSLIRMSCAAAFSGYTAQYAALEQTRPDIAMQVHAFASSEFGKDVFKSLDLAQGRNYETKKYLDFLRFMREQVQGRMHVSDNSRGNLTPATMAAQIERNKADIYFLDFLTLMEGADDWQSVAALSTAIKRTATRYHIPIVTAAQINRTGAGSQNQGLETIGASDRIGQDADLVINAQRFSKRVVVFRVVKFRHGPGGAIFYLKFDPNLGVMEEITYEKAMDLKDADEGDEEESKEKKFVPRRRGSFHETALANRRSETTPQAATANGHSSPKVPATRLRRPV